MVTTARRPFSLASSAEMPATACCAIHGVTVIGSYSSAPRRSLSEIGGSYQPEAVSRSRIRPPNPPRRDSTRFSLIYSFVTVSR